MDTKFDQLIDFPSVQTFKIMGLATPELPELVIQCLQRLAPGDYSPSIRPSRKGNYHAVSVAVTVTSKEHMESIYTELAKIDIVKAVL